MFLFMQEVFVKLRPALDQLVRSQELHRICVSHLEDRPN
jgi:hypothetical protein